MRSAPVLVAVAVLLAGLAVMVPSWLLDDRDYLAVTPQPPPVEQPTQLELLGEQSRLHDARRARRALASRRGSGR